MTEKSSCPLIGEFAISTLSVANASTQILERLGNRYCLLQLDKTIDDFAKEVLRPLAASCLVSCDHIPRRSMALFRAKAVLDELIGGLPSRLAHRLQHIA